MIWKGCLVLSVALCVLCEGRSAFSEVTVKKPYKVHQTEVSKSDHKATENHEEYAKSHPSYEFSYKVIDPHTHDKKGQQETRDGDKVTGHYWLIQPDGHKRLIKYSVDGKHGFTADINYALHDEHNKGDSEHDVHELEHENKDHEKENDHNSDDNLHEDIKEEKHEDVKEEKHENVKEKIHEEMHDEIKEKKHEDIKEEIHENIKKETHEDTKKDKLEHKEPEKEFEEFESKKIHEVEKEKKIEENHHEEDKKGENKRDEALDVHEKEEKHNGHKNKKNHNDLWSQIRDWGKLEIEEKHDDVWSWPKIYTWGGEMDRKNDKKHKVHKEHDNNEGNVWSWRKHYDVWEVEHNGDKKKEENDNKDKPINVEHTEKRPEDDGGKRKNRRRNVGLRDHEYRGQPTYHMPIMKTKPITYRRRIIVN